MATKVNTRVILKNDELSNWLSGASVDLKKGEVALAKMENGKYEVRIGNGLTGEAGKYISSDMIQISASQVVGLEQTITSLSTSFFEVSALTDITTKPANGSIAVVTADIDGTHKEYTAYYYDTSLSGGTWRAMDGNYSAENVYFPSNMTMTYAFGKYTVPSSGSYTLNCKGQSVQAMINDAFAQTVQPTAVKPTASWTSPSNKGSQEVGTYVTGLDGLTFTYTADGYYSTYNNNLTAGNVVPLSSLTITRTAAQVEDFNGNIYNLTAINKVISADSTATGTVAVKGTQTITSLNGSDLSVQVTSADQTLATYTGSASYLSGTSKPVTNIGTAADLTSYVQAGNFTGKSATVKVPAGFRYKFFGYRTYAEGPIGCYDADGNVSKDISLFDATKITSTNIRDEIHAIKQTGWLTSFTVPAGSQQIIFAVPHADVNTAHTYIKMNNPSLGNYNFENDGKITAQKFKVEGANGYAGVDYDIWYINPTGSFAADATYAITYGSSKLQ